ncbi:dTDP-4-keto-6-deoxy-D-glucose epimerase [Rhodococcus sp. ABRD24]|uniref:dTDP-4-dehydrorhamnose 3,5-epimerase family protein n=1 Tax=Rhodococcus sp. ABRD24 TaxID=2507582 RepID=UPI00103C36DC|nr:dTDP-4-dehydrorhamnose 3,5-epimerase family protein [Rhodococcus sp. ABRD24]QBJ98641.1 dTDP-4-keto-6-deoxy-D-glucose epimerase [Rhodococcus sp. ABRD24]
MQIRELAVSGGFEFTPEPIRDGRGIFAAPLQDSSFVGAVGHRFPVAQMNHIVSSRGVLRGLHYTTTPPGQCKYVFCAHGRALDIIVDIRIGSPTFGCWDAVQMDTEHYRAVYFPKGTAHAFLALEDNTVMSYLVSTPYTPEYEQAIDPLDPALALPWPKDVDFILSDRDTVAPGLEAAGGRGMLPLYTDCIG